LKINVGKSNMYDVGVSLDKIANMAASTGCAAGNLPFNYLGITIGASMATKGRWDNIVQRNSSNDGRNTRRSYVQEEVIDGTNVQNDAGNIQRTLQTTSSGTAANVQCYNCSEKGHYACNCPKPRVRDSKIQPATFDSDAWPSYDSTFFSEVQTPSTNYVNPLFAKDKQQQKYLKQPKVINNTIGDDQIDSNIIFDEPDEDVNSGSVEYDNNVQESYELEQLARNVFKEAEKQQIIAKKTYEGDRTLLKNFDMKFIGTVHFGNNHFAAITGYDDYAKGNIIVCHVYYVEGLTVCHVYYVEGLGHNLFNVGQFYDDDLEVALEGNDLLIGARESNLYTISNSDMAASSPVCLLCKANSTKSWLWHRRLSYLNFDTINDLTKHDLVDGLPKFKYSKDHMCSVCERGKRKKSSHPPKVVPSNHSKLELLHMDLCGPMRVASIDGKKYILVIVDDYSRFTWNFFGPRQFPPLALLKIANDREDLGKMKPKADIGIFIGYSETSRCNDESSTESMNTPSKENLDNLFGPMYKEYFKKRSSGMSINFDAHQVHNHENSPSTSLIIIKEHEVPPIGTISEEQTSPISLNEADYFNQDDSANFDGELKLFLGLQVHQSSHGIFISQPQYTTELLKKHGMDECASMSTPMATERLDADFEGTPTNQTTYRRMIGGLMNLTSGRPDTAIVTFVCARYQARLTIKYLKECHGHTLKEDGSKYKLSFVLDKKELTMTLDDFKTIFHLPQATDNNHDRFVCAPKFLEMVPFYTNNLGFPLELRSPSNFKANGLVQPWKALCKIFSKCMTPQVTGYDQPPLQIMQMLS
nr:integrase, catalytic region, zinc finger, CCHC-type, peptidase aspartic, catalytic [Tanacetum cinerariifolium]